MTKKKIGIVVGLVLVAALLGFGAYKGSQSYRELQALKANSAEQQRKLESLSQMQEQDTNSLEGMTQAQKEQKAKECSEQLAKETANLGKMNNYLTQEKIDLAAALKNSYLKECLGDNSENMPASQKQYCKDENEKNIENRKKDVEYDTKNVADIQKKIDDLQASCAAAGL